MVNVFGDEVGGVEAGVNEDRITQDDFAWTGGAVAAVVSSHGMM